MTAPPPWRGRTQAPVTTEPHAVYLPELRAVLSPFGTWQPCGFEGWSNFTRVTQLAR